MNGRENKTCTTYQAAVQQPVWTALGPAKTEDCFKPFVSQLRFSSFAVQVMRVDAE